MRRRFLFFASLCISLFLFSAYPAAQPYPSNLNPGDILPPLAGQSLYGFGAYSDACHSPPRRLRPLVGSRQRANAGRIAPPFEAESMAAAPCNPKVGNVRNRGLEMLNSA
jgi:hypothetical protein